jgi:hypothetical protein
MGKNLAVIGFFTDYLTEKYQKLWFNHADSYGMAIYV